MAELAPYQATATLGRLVLDFRLLALLVSLLWFPFTPGGVDGRVRVAMLIAALVSFALLVRWDRLAPVLTRHPVLFALDCGLSVAILLTTGTDGPFLAYTFGTAFLAGVLYGWAGAAVFSSILVGGDLVAVATGPAPVTFQALVGTPFLYVGLAAGAAAVRDVLVRQAGTEAELAVALQERATADERARLAREMHDKLGKTIHGIALHASALALRIGSEPEQGGSRQAALALADAAQHAAVEARELISDLRADLLDAPLDEAVTRVALAWSQRTGVDVQLQVRRVASPEPATRYELVAVLKEALRNVERHADATAVEVDLGMAGNLVRLSVDDDGRGLAGHLDPAALAAGGHFGIVGMQERMAGVGGTLRVGPRAPRGTAVTATVPAASALPVRALQVTGG